MNKTRNFIVLLILATLLTSCSKFQKMLNDDSNPNAKFDAALEYFRQEQYHHALRLFEDLKNQIRGTSKDEDLNYHIAYCYYHEKDYVLGNYFFNKFTKEFPLSKNSEEAKFMAAYCSYKDSPRYSLDQKTTMEAIKEFQIFIDMYPNSERIQQCNKILDELRMKLEKKDYENAFLFYKIGDYNASVIALLNVLEDYPETNRKEEILYTILKARYIFANNSIDLKQKERFELVLVAYKNLVGEFPKSGYIVDANNIYNKSLTELEKRKNGL